MRKQPFTILIHVALVIIVAGAIVTHFFGVQGTLRLTIGESADRFEITSGPGEGRLPFTVELKDIEILTYPGTSTPMDFKSLLIINGEQVTVAMNSIGEHDGWRFYQSGMGDNGSVLSISHDPAGIAITYTGYVLLGFGMLGFFLQPGTFWRALLRRRKSAAWILGCLATFTCSAERGTLPAMQRPLAADFGKVYVYWNDRIAPMQTMARDVTLSLYGADSYNGFTAEQVLSGWLFYYDEWYRDYCDRYPEIQDPPLSPATKRERKILEKTGIIQWLGTGEAFRIFPYKTKAGQFEWLSLTGRRPSGMDLEQWTYMQTSMQQIKGLLLRGRNVMADEKLDTLICRQIRYAGKENLPSSAKIKGERIYNQWGRPMIAGIIALLYGLSMIIAGIRQERYAVMLRIGGLAMTLALWCYVTFLMAMLWWISGHIPLSNGPETMMFMAWAALTGALLPKSGYTTRGAMLIIGGAALMVAAMGGKTPKIGMLMPVLSSPLLSIHVMVVMISYVLFMLMAILSAIALLSKSEKRAEQLSVTNRLILIPAIFLLGAGIFIGAVWANQSWGRYWGWDPKETCALIMWIIYSIPAHWGSKYLKGFRKPKTLHLYLLLSLLSVIFTYFGANYLLPGLHSYA